MKPDETRQTYQIVSTKRTSSRTVRCEIYLISVQIKTLPIYMCGKNSYANNYYKRLINHYS